jgi:cell division protein FtsZ
MTINLQKPDITELKPRITVFGVGGGGGNAVNNMINAGLKGVDFVVANTDAQALTMTRCERVIQLGVAVTEGLGAGSQPEVGRAAAEECIDEILDHLQGTHMCFVTAGMGGGTGTGAAPVVARAARERGILTVGVVTKPFHFEGARRMKTADMGIEDLQKNVDTLIVIPNQNLFRIANDKTTFADAFAMADQVLYSGVACITDLMVKEGLINLDFADVRSVMRDMGKAMMGTGEASGEGRAMAAAEAAIANPLLDESSMKGAKGLLISITGGRDMTLFEVDEAATRIREEVDQEANIILGATFDESLEGIIRVSVVATGIDKTLADIGAAPVEFRQTARPVVRQAPPAQIQRPVPRPVETAEAVNADAETESADSIADVIRMAETEIAAVTRTADPEFRPASGLFRPAAQAEPPRAPQPAPQVPVQQRAPQPQVFAAETRMPRVEDFPPVVKAEMEQRSLPAPMQPASEQAGALGLLRRITQGLTRRDDDSHTHQQIVQPREPVMQRPVEPRRPLSQEAAAYAPRRNPLDEQGRAAPQPRATGDEDALEIPAFLRRQG